MFVKWLSGIIAIILIFTSIPFTDLVVDAAENTEIEMEEVTSPTNQGNLSTITSGEAPPFQNTDPKEVVELRTESSKVVDNGDGTFTMQMFQDPISRKSDGKWKEIQPDLKKQKASRLYTTESTSELATKNTLLDIRFSPELSKNKYAALSYKGHTLTYTFLEASGENGVQEVQNTDATYEDNRIYYKDIIPGLTLRNIVFDESVKEDIILSKYNGTNTYHFFIETDLMANIEDNGSISLRDQKNEIIYTLPKPYMTDSNINPESAEPQRSEDVHFELKRENNGYSFTVVANEEWLKDPERIYPVYIDPTTKVQVNQDASVSSAYPNANYGTDWDSGLGANVLKAGNYSADTGENFAYVKTPTPSLPYATIETAIFNIYNIHSYYPGTNTGIWLDRVNGAWDESTITWNNKPSSSLFTSTSVYKGNWATFNVKNAVNDWIKGTTPNNGFKLHTNGNGQTFWKKFYSSEHSVADYRPHLNIAYSYPSPIGLSAESYSLGSGTGYMDLKWNAVAGASSYNVWIFDGKEYKPINVGNKTEWSTKDKSVWPKVGPNLPVNPQQVYKDSGGTSYIDRTNYAISVSAVFANGESPKANPIVPNIPDLNMPPAPKGVAYSNQIGTNSGYVNLEWDAIKGATGYKVWIFNGLSYEAFDVKNATSWTTQNKGMWPKPEQIQAGTSSTLKLIKDGSGVELPIDPSPLYAKMGTKYATNNNYWFRISAYNQHGESVFSNATIINLLPQSTDFDKNLGFEEYWDYASHDISNGTNYVNLGTNNNVIQYTDFSLFNYAGFGLDFIRTYNSKDFEKSAFGYGWSFTGSEKLYIGANGTDIDYKDADGTVHVFTWDGNKYVAPAGIYDRLEKLDTTTYILTSNTGHTTTFKVKESTSDTDVQVAYITEQKDLNSNIITYTYNTLNQLTAITTNLGAKLLFTYTDGLITNVNYDDKEITYSYTDGYLTRVLVDKDATTKTPTTFYYTTNGQLTKIIDSNQKIMLYEYNSDLDLVTVTEPSLDGQVASITNYSLDRTNNIVTITSPEDTVTRYGLNNNFSVTKMFDPSGDTTTYTLDDNYNVLSQKVSYTDGSTYTKNYDYDSKGNVLKISDSKGVTESFTYDAYSNLLTQTDTSNQTSTKTYVKGNLKTSTTPNGETTTYEYNDYGDITQVKYPDGKIEKYNTNYENKQKTTTYRDDQLDITTKTTTDYNGNILSYEDGKNEKTWYSYNLKNELVEVEDAENKKTTYTYDANSNLTSVTNAGGKQTSFGYNAQNDISKETNALGKTTTYNYNADGELNEIIKASGDRIGYTMSKDINSELVKINDQNQYTTQIDSLTTTVTNHTLNNQKVTYTQAENDLLQRIDISAPVNRAIMYTYKNEEDLASIQYDTNTIEYTTDGNGQTTAVTLNGQPSASFTWNKNSMLESTTFRNSAVILNKYNADQLQTETLKTNSVTTWRTNEYEFDKNKQISKVTNEDGSVTYTYDALNQLVKEQYSNGLSISYTYDSVGNRTSKTNVQNGSTTTTNYSYNDANQMKAAGEKTYTVSANGNMINDGVFQYVWNAFDQLTEVKNLTGTTVATYSYDENGRRVYSKDSKGETYYRYNGLTNEVLFEEDASGNLTKAYTYGDNGHLLTMTYQGSTYYYLTNYRGDVLALTDANGAIVAEYTYDAWGNIKSQSGTMATINPYRYAGYRYDEDTNLYYLMARYYNPDTGVFLSLDPERGDVMNPLTLNGFSYANNNPVMNVDHDGRYWKNAWWNAKSFLSKTINAVIFLVSAQIGGGVAKVLLSYSKKQLSEAKRTTFAVKIRKSLIQKGVSAKIAGYIVTALTSVAGLASFYTDPGTPIFKWLDARDKYPKNGYFNGF